MPTGEELAAQLEHAIELGELTTQYAPGGHPLFQALDDAREILAWLKDNASIIPSLPSAAHVPTTVAAAINAIETAAASVRVDPDKPLPKTIWPVIRDKWPWIAAGAVALIAIGQLIERRD